VIKFKLSLLPFSRSDRIFHTASSKTKDVFNSINRYRDAREDAGVSIILMYHEIIPLPVFSIAWHISLMINLFAAYLHVLSYENFDWADTSRSENTRSVITNPVIRISQRQHVALCGQVDLPSLEITTTSPRTSYVSVSGVLTLIESRANLTGE